MKETKEKIILKALQYFTENDYEGASLNKIAESIGITKGGIYHYFDSKDELFRECIVFMFSALENISMPMVSGDLTLEELIYGLFSFEAMFNALASRFQIELLNDHFNYAYLMFVGIKKFPDIKERVGKIYSSILAESEKALIKFQRGGELDPSLDCSALAFELGFMIEGAMLLAGFSEDIDLKIIGSQMADNVIKMIRA